MSRTTDLSGRAGAAWPGVSVPESPTSGSYEPPRLVVLGTVAELTAGGSTGPSDGMGGAGAMGTVS